MSDKRDDGGAAFPSLERVDEYSDAKGRYIEHFLPVGGMSLRDYFAGQALIGLVARFEDQAPFPSRALASDAYIVADAMIAERKK